jgi:arsenite methyltransferase
MPNSVPSLTLDNEQLARDYDRISSTRQFESGKRLVEDLDIQPGERVIDIGCGTGLLAEHVADLVGPAGSVLGIDPLPLRIELAEAKARTRSNLSFQVGDAYALDGLPTGAFDVVVLNAVFHWLPEKTGPLRSFARLLYAGGRLGISTGLRGQVGDMHKAIAQAMAEPPFDRYPRAWNRATFRVDEGEMRELLGAAGFTPLLVEVRATEQFHASPEAAMRFSEASSFGNVLGHLPEDLKPLAREVVKKKLASIATPQGIVQRGRRLIAIAERK